MLLNIFKERHGFPYPEGTPGSVNSFLSDPTHYGFVGNADLSFEFAAGLYTGNRVLLKRRLNVRAKPHRQSDLAEAIRLLDASLMRGDPALVWLPSTTEFGHYVVAIGRCGDRYLIADPWWTGQPVEFVTVEVLLKGMLGIRTFKRGA